MNNTRIFATLRPDLELAAALRAHRLPGETASERRARLDAARDMAAEGVGHR